tara:strand:- start:20387 stop:22333 length:1947 start_codon:yes stop_codon:yes gene_type:complete
MPSIVTNNFRIHNAKQFLRSLSYGDSAWAKSVEGPFTTESFLYLFIGKARPWEDTHTGFSDSNIPNPDGTVQEAEYEVWRDMLAVQKVANTDISFAAKRVNWTSGTVYEMYDDKDATIVSGTGNGHYILTASGTEYNVFKCIHRDNAAHMSTVEPSKPSSATAYLTQTTTDGYVWKYMYSIPSSIATKFMTTNFIPVRTLTANQVAGGASDTILTNFGLAAYTDQKKVQIYANTGTIDSYVVEETGVGYRSSEASGITSPALSSLSTNTVVVTGSNLSGSDDFYNGCAFYVANTTKIWGVSKIVDYVASSKTFVLDPAFTDTNYYGGDNGGTTGGGIDTGGTLASASFQIGPLVTIEGDGGMNQISTTHESRYANTAYARALTTSEGALWRVLPVSKGLGYSHANVHISSTPAGSGAKVRAVISPNGGHGSDPVSELNAYNVAVNVVLSTSTLNLANSFPSDNEYRRIGLLRNPVLANTSEHLAPTGSEFYANTTTLHQTLQITVNNTVGLGGSWTPAKDERVRGESSNATAYVVEYNKHNSRTLVLSEITSNSKGNYGHTQGSLSGSFTEYDKIMLDSDNSKYMTANGAGILDNAPRTGWGSGGWTREAIRGPELVPFSGEILYSETRSPISRSSDQTEDVKIIFEF